MANTYKALSTVTVGAGGTASIDFTNIPQTYTDLQILFSVRSTGNYNADGLGLLIKFNDSTTNFSFRALEGNGTSAISWGYTTNQIAGIGGGANVTANTFSNSSIYIPNYTNSNNKSFATDSVMENNGTTVADDMYASLWSNTTAITKITIYPSAANFAQYSTATLYGVFNADVSSAPATPTIGTATAGVAQASITFTPVSNAASYTMTSTPGSITATGASSPIVVTGLSGGTNYTFKVKSNNPFGSSAESAASNSVTPITAAYESIGTVTVGAGGVASVSFSSIPSTYTHLEIRSLNINTGTGSSPWQSNNLVRFNDDSGNNYAWHYVLGNGSSVSAGASTSTSSILGGKGGNLNGSYTNYAGFQVTSILDYANTNKNKTVRTLTGAEFNGSGEAFFSSGLWLNTNAITKITITNDSGNLAQYSTYALYGIKSS